MHVELDVEAMVVEKNPALHCTHELAPTILDDHVPALHNKHAELDAAPRVVEYIPARQGAQTNDPADDHDPTPQLMHTAVEVAPVIVDAVPALQ